MKIIIWFFVLLFSTSLLISTNLRADDAEILAIFNDQVEAYNQRDVARMVANVSDDFKWYSLTADQLLVETSGKSAFKKSMENYYRARSNKTTSVIESYLIDGNRISFKEVVSHKNPQGKQVTSSAMGIYQIKDGKVFRAWYFID